MTKRAHVEVNVGSISLVYVGAKVSRNLADRFSRRCEELDCSVQETLTAFMEAFVDGPGEPQEPRENVSNGFPPAGDRWPPTPSPLHEDWPKEEDICAFWKDMQHTAEGERESRLPFVITPFQN
ncbi:MAG: hypothetical protein QJR01_02705 [Kyrpidia sp.]|nr:hypothetical protein [Kyrpidia sp.]